MVEIESKASKRITTKQILEKYQLYLFLLPTLIWIVVFRYVPMYGVQIAFKKFIASKGIMGSPWVGMDHFVRFFNSYNFADLLKNTIGLSVYGLLFSFPLPIILALLLNQFKHEKYKKFVQTVIYAPNFISVVVLVGMMMVFLSPSSGLINKIIQYFGGETVFFFGEADWFQPMYILSGIWQTTGFGTIVYLGALAGISQELHEAAIVDGANKLQRIIYVDIPGILPTIVIMLILALGGIMGIGHEKALLMQTALNMQKSSILPTYVYQVGLEQAQYSFSTAVGLFNSIINLVLVVGANKLSRKLSNTSLW